MSPDISSLQAAVQDALDTVSYNPTNFIRQRRTIKNPLTGKSINLSIANTLVASDIDALFQDETFQDRVGNYTERHQDISTLMDTLDNDNKEKLQDYLDRHGNVLPLVHLTGMSLRRVIVSPDGHLAQTKVTLRGRAEDNSIEFVTNFVINNTARRLQGPLGAFLYQGFGLRFGKGNMMKDIFH